MHSDWETNFFRGIALEAWRRCVTAEITSTEADFLERALAIQPGANLLDVPCGNGRHAIELSRASGLWCGLKIVTAVADGSSPVDLAADWPAPLQPDGAGPRPPTAAAPATAPTRLAGRAARRPLRTPPAGRS